MCRGRDHGYACSSWKLLGPDNPSWGLTRDSYETSFLSSFTPFFVCLSVCLRLHLRLLSLHNTPSRFFRRLPPINRAHLSAVSEGVPALPIPPHGASLEAQDTSQSRRNKFGLDYTLAVRTATVYSNLGSTTFLFALSRRPPVALLALHDNFHF